MSYNLDDVKSHEFFHILRKIKLLIISVSLGVNM